MADTEDPLMQFLTEFRGLLEQGQRRQAAALVDQAVLDNRAGLGEDSVTLAHLTVLLAEWPKISAWLPRDSNWLESSGWLETLLYALPVTRVGDPIPWWTYPAIDWIAAAVASHWRVFEWGAGYSTLWWAGQSAWVRAVDHSADWVRTLADQLPAHATVVHRSEQAGYLAALDEAAADLRAEEGSGRPWGGFDAIVVDGEHRVQCLAAAPAHLAPKGIVIVDNADSPDLMAPLADLERKGFFRIDFYGLIPGFVYKNCTSVCFRDPAVLRAVRPPARHRSPLGPTVGRRD